MTRVAVWPALATLAALLLGGGAWWAADRAFDMVPLHGLGLVGPLCLLFLALCLMEAGLDRLAARARNSEGETEHG